MSKQQRCEVELWPQERELKSQTEDTYCSETTDLSKLHHASYDGTWFCSVESYRKGDFSLKRRTANKALQ